MNGWADIRVLTCPVCGFVTQDPKLHYIRPVSNPYFTQDEYVEVTCGRCGFFKKFTNPADDAANAAWAEAQQREASRFLVALFAVILVIAVVGLFASIR